MLDPSLFVNSPKAALLLTSVVLLAAIVGLPSASTFLATARLPRTEDETVLVAAGLTGAALNAPLAGSVPVRDRVVGAFSSVTVVRVGILVRRVYKGRVIAGIKGRMSSNTIDKNQSRDRVKQATLDEVILYVQQP
jgi:hypothetical protein